MSTGKIRIATRGSSLSLIQTQIVADKLAECGVECEYVIVRPKGDRDKESPLTKIGGDGLFVRGLEETLLLGQADIAVHSAKDLPYDLAEGLMIGAVPDMADPRDVLLMRRALGAAPVIGTDSPRRREDIRMIFPGAEFRSLRGNVPTRLDKLRDGQYDAIVLAKAGLDRLQADLSGLQERILSPEELIPAPCQGIIAVECRKGDDDLLTVLREINDPRAQKRFEIERYVFTRLRADCSVPIGVYAQIREERATVRASFRDRKAAAEGLTAEYQSLCDGIVSRLTDDASGEDRNTGTVRLVGAGPGAGTLTIDGLEAVRQAEVICYDDLIDKDILKYAASGCEKIPVGKRGGRHMMKQEAITHLLIDLALSGKQVVRLKGGDSFVFGRGSEEAGALKEQGIPFEVIPGVSSAIAVPESFGIPVTHRGTASSFTVVTGHGADGRSLDYESLAHNPGTLVILMGLHNLRDLCGRLAEHGMDPNRPAAVLSCGFSAGEKRYDGTVGTISDIAREAQAPAIVIVGDVARMNLRGDMRKLRGKKIEIAGTEHFNRRLAQMLRGSGACVTQVDTLRVVPDPGALPENLNGYAWMVLTSPNGVRALREGLAMRGADARALAGVRIACVGPGTEKALAECGLRADLVPEVHSAAGLARELVSVLTKDQRVLLVRGEKASPVLPEELEAAGIVFDSCALYRTESAMGRGTCAAGETPCEVPETDMIVFSSGSAAEAYLKERRIAKGAKIICMGESAERVVRTALRGDGSARESAADRIKLPKQSNLQEIYELILLSAKEEEEDK